MKVKIFLLSFLIISQLAFTQRKTSFPLVTAAAKGNLGKVKSYVKKGEDINQKNRARWTALAYAIKYDYPDIVKYLIENGADINETVNTGETPLQIALKNSRFDIAKYLVSKNADVNRPDVMEMPPLAWAVKDKNINKVKFLVENGASVNQQNISGRTPLDMCEDYKIKQYLISNGAKLSQDLL